MNHYKPYLYGAYGSNLNLKQMSFRCPKAHRLGTVMLDDYRLTFRGVADVEPCKNSGVPLALWRITEECEQALDRYEGFPRLYGKHFVDLRNQKLMRTYDSVIENVNDGLLTIGLSPMPKIMIYRMVDDQTVYPPLDPYLDSIVQGYEDFELPLVCLKDAVRLSYTEETA